MKCGICLADSFLKYLLAVNLPFLDKVIEIGTATPVDLVNISLRKRSEVRLIDFVQIAFLCPKPHATGRNEDEIITTNFVESNTAISW